MVPISVMIVECILFWRIIYCIGIFGTKSVAICC